MRTNCWRPCQSQTRAVASKLSCIKGFMSCIKGCMAQVSWPQCHGPSAHRRQAVESKERKERRGARGNVTGALEYGAIWHNMVQHGATRCNTVQHGGCNMNAARQQSNLPEMILEPTICRKRDLCDGRMYRYVSHVSVCIACIGNLDSTTALRIQVDYNNTAYSGRLSVYP